MGNPKDLDPKNLTPRTRSMNNVAKKILPNFGSSEAANKSDGFWSKNKIETYQSKQEKQHDPIQTMSTRDANHLQTYKPQDLCKKCLGSQAGLSM